MKTRVLLKSAESERSKIYNTIIFDDPKGNKYQELEDCVTELERTFGQLTMENEILKKLRTSWQQATKKQIMIDQLKASHLFTALCKILDVYRNSYYKVSKFKKKDWIILTAIEKVIVKWLYNEYRRITQELKRKGDEIGETHIRRLFKEIDHSCSMGETLNPFTNGQHEHPRHLKFNQNNVFSQGYTTPPPLSRH